MTITGANLGAFGDLEITENSLKNPAPELREFVRDLNKLNDEYRWSVPEWQQAEASRVKSKRQREAELKRDTERIQREFR